MKELLIRFLDYYLNQSSVNSLCFSISNMKHNKLLNDVEFTQLLEFIQNNRPDEVQHYQFYNDDGTGFWWNIKDREIRIKFIKHLIENEHIN